MKFVIFGFIVILVFTLIYFANVNNFSAEQNDIVEIAPNVVEFGVWEMVDFLVATGMSAENVQNLDEYTLKFIVSTLIDHRQSEVDWLTECFPVYNAAVTQELSSAKKCLVLEEPVVNIEYINLEVISPALSIAEWDINSNLQPFNDNIKFSTLAFWIGENSVTIFASYELTQAVNLRGRNSFSVNLGNGLLPYNYTGIALHRANLTDDWQLFSNMLPTQIPASSGAEFLGTSQLGETSFFGRKLMRGTVAMQANINPNSDIYHITLSYLHNPNNAQWQTWFHGEVSQILYLTEGRAYIAATGWRLDK
ncbi:MAG: hypothetical protein FWG64_12110 [Firmicutes bacterium]|nr:hypothetical protein [Bacillota bacterium]